MGDCWQRLLGRRMHSNLRHASSPETSVVFDSIAQDSACPLTMPNLNNTLIVVLIRFRKAAVGFTVYIQQTFHCFLVRKPDRNFLRFLWFRDIDPSKDIIEGPCLREQFFPRSLDRQEGNSDVKQFVNQDFYVDDGLKSFPTSDLVLDSDALQTAPLPELTVPRLELCAAVLAVELAQIISSEINM